MGYQTVLFGLNKERNLYPGIGLGDIFPRDYILLPFILKIQ